MSPAVWGVLVLGMLFVFVALRIPIALALMAAGFIGYAGLDGVGRALLVVGAVPGEMIRGYSFSVVPLFVLMGTVAAAGSVAAGGTLGILIPPSAVLVIYALLAEESVPALFAAAFIPGALLTLFAIIVAKVVASRPGVAPPVEEPAERPHRALLATWKLGFVFALASCWIGLTLSYVFPETPSGPAIVLVAGVFFLISAIFGPLGFGGRLPKATAAEPKPTASSVPDERTL